MCTITGSFGKDCVLVILFQHHGPKPDLLKVIFSWWISMTPSSFTLKEELIEY